MASVTATYYFNTYDSGGEEWETTPANMVDGNPSNYATETNDDAVQLLTGNTCIDIYRGKISQVELRGFAKRTQATPLNLIIRPVFTDGDGDNHSYGLNETGKYSSYYDITNDTNAPEVWTWAKVVALDVDAEVDEVVGGNTLSCSNMQIRVTYDTNFIRFVNDDSDAVYLTMPSSLAEATVKSVENLVFNDGTDAQLSRGKMSDSLTLSGQETSSATLNMEMLNTFMDAQRIVTVSGLPDSNLNTDYRIVNLGFSQEAGMMNRYNYSIVLERIFDRLG